MTQTPSTDAAAQATGVADTSPGTIAAPVQPGQVLAGKYLVEKVIGVGGMGVVVAARHLQLDERVALKFLLPEALGSADVVARFGREARSAVKIKSEHVARVIDVGVLETGAPYMVMEYLEGRDLSAIVHEQGPLPVADVVEYVVQACEALAEAHALGIVHRDMKPANLFLSRRADGSKMVKVLDFGISKASLTGAAFADLSLTRTTAVMGSPLYMSPEQMKSARDVDHRSDIWSMGVVLHELLTGKVAFEGESITQLCAAVLQEPPPPLRLVRPDAPEELERVVLRCLEKGPAQRYQSMGELAIALTPFGPDRIRVSAERSAALSASAGLSSPDLKLPVVRATATTGSRTGVAWEGSGPQRS
jgi:eukaryotic-like serine/threonine-protein kinase